MHGDDVSFYLKFHHSTWFTFFSPHSPSKTLFQLNFLEADVAQSLLLLVEHIIISYFRGHRSRDPGYQTQKNVNPFAPERFKMQKK